MQIAHTVTLQFEEAGIGIISGTVPKSLWHSHWVSTRVSDTYSQAAARWSSPSVSCRTHSPNPLIRPLSCIHKGLKLESRVLPFWSGCESGAFRFTSVVTAEGQPVMLAAGSLLHALAFRSTVQGSDWLELEWDMKLFA